MATKNMAYDSPAYTLVRTQPFAIAAGGSALSVPKYLAFTSEIVKSVTVKPTTAGTSSSVMSLIQISGTTTTTYGLGTTGSAATVFSNYLPGSACNLIQGDTCYVVSGTDATVAYAGNMEIVTTPGANVTS